MIPGNRGVLDRIEVTDQAIQFAEASSEPSPDALFEDVYSMPYGPFTRSEQ